MMYFQTVFLFLVGLCTPQIFLVTASECSSCCGGGNPYEYRNSYLPSSCGSVSPYPYAPSCASPEIQLVPVPQPFPIKVPKKKEQQQQSVTIPNIILALLPPTTPKSKPTAPPCSGRAPLPPPIRLPVPVPQPYPVPVCNTGCSSYY